MAITTAMATSAKLQFLLGGHCFAATVTPTGSAVSGSTSVTSVSSMAGVSVGMAVSGTNIAANTVVAAITSTTAFTLSIACTGTITGGTLTMTGDVFKVALIKASPAGTYGAASTNYSDITGNSDEASGAGYTAGGYTLANIAPASSGTTAYTSFVSNPSWTSATFTCSGCMVYNSSIRTNGTANAAIACYDFGGTQTVSSGTFTVVLPTDNSSLAAIRIA